MTEMADKEKITCPICGREFKDKSGLAGHMRFKHSEKVASGESKSAAVTTTRKGQSPLEVLVKDLHLPVMVDGQADIFDAGVEYGFKSILVGVRIAQELSAMGVQQASPIIQMAKEMRESEGQAAQVIASQLAEATLENNKGIMEAIKAQGVASSPNPMWAGLLQTMMPMFQQSLGRFMGTFTGIPAGQQQPQQPGQQQPQQPGQQATKDEVKEAFNE